MIYRLHIVLRYKRTGKRLFIIQDSVNHDFIYPLDDYVACTPVGPLSSGFIDCQPITVLKQSFGYICFTPVCYSQSFVSHHSVPGVWEVVKR